MKLRAFLVSLVAVGAASSALAHSGPGNYEIAGALTFYVLILWAVAVPVSMLLPNRRAGERIGLGIAVPLLGMAAGMSGAWLVGDEVGAAAVFLVATIVPVLALVVYVLAQRAKFNYPVQTPTEDTSK